MAASENLRELRLGDRSLLWAFGSAHTVITDCRNKWLWIIPWKCFPLELDAKVLTAFSRIPQIRCPISLTFSNVLFILYLLSGPGPGLWSLFLPLSTSCSSVPSEATVPWPGFLLPILSSTMQRETGVYLLM